MAPARLISEAGLLRLGAGTKSMITGPRPALIAYLGGLTVTQGRLAGEPFRVLPWEARFVRGAFRPGVPVRGALDRPGERQDGAALRGSRARP